MEIEENYCALPPDVNRCEFYNATDATCLRENPNPCGMLIKPAPGKSQQNYVRKPRWYEKYYGRK